MGYYQEFFMGNKRFSVKRGKLPISWLILLNLLLAAALFLVDLQIPLGVAGGVPYVAVILVSLWCPGRRWTVFFAILCTGLTILGFYGSPTWVPTGGQLWKVLANRFLAVFAISVTAILSLQQKRVQMVLRKHRERLEDEIQVRTGELRAANEGLEEENLVRQQVSDVLLKTATELRLLNETGDLLQSCVNAKEAYAIVGQFAERLFPGTSGALHVMNSSSTLVETVLHWGESRSMEPFFGPDECWALRRGTTHLVKDPSHTPVCRHVTGTSPNDLCVPLLCIPMIAKGETLGVLYLEGFFCPNQDEQVEEGGAIPRQDLARALAGDIAQVIANLRLRERLAWQANHDPLTGLYNRRFMEESLDRELERSVRRESSLGIMMLDLDHFKRFNDTFGHAAGDTLLREVGVFLRTHTRGEDIACRYGGEEFALILPDTSLDDCQRRAEQLLEGIRHLRVDHRQQSLGAITVSLGLSVFPFHGKRIGELLRAADQALYQAKEEGRNRVVAAGLPKQENKLAS